MTQDITNLRRHAAENANDPTADTYDERLK